MIPFRVYNGEEETVVHIICEHLHGDKNRLIQGKHNKTEGSSAWEHKPPLPVIITER